MLRLLTKQNSIGKPASGVTMMRRERRSPTGDRRTASRCFKENYYRAQLLDRFLFIRGLFYQEPAGDWFKQFYVF
jgi:hypothetical protein